MDKVNGMLRPFGYVYYNDVDRQLEVRPGKKNMKAYIEQVYIEIKKKLKVVAFDVSNIQEGFRHISPKHRLNPNEMFCSPTFVTPLKN